MVHLTSSSAAGADPKESLGYQDFPPKTNHYQGRHKNFVVASKCIYTLRKIYIKRTYYAFIPLSFYYLCIYAVILLC